VEHVKRGEVLAGSVETVEIPARDEATWFEVRIPLALVEGGDRLRITAKQNAWRSFHAWLVRP